MINTLRQQIGQMLVLGFTGSVLSDAADIKECLSTEGLGGVILFDYDLLAKQPGKNLFNQGQIKNLINELQYCAQQNTHSLPLFIAIDYEGGAVDRLKYIDGCPPTLTPQQLAVLPADALKLEAKKMASTLKSLGFNLNFAPVVDLNLNEKAGIIGKLKRSFSADPKHTAEIAAQFVQAFAELGIICCYKHFPGHGSANSDTHEGFVDVSESFQQIELQPYQYLIKNTNLPTMIMTAHVINKQLDNSGLPATLSKEILTNLLRKDLGFTGVIISDDLQMHAISNHYSIDEALELTINAGSDMIIVANQLASISPKELINKIEALVLKGAIKQSMIENAYKRILRLKENLSYESILMNYQSTERLTIN